MLFQEFLGDDAVEELEDTPSDWILAASDPGRPRWTEQLADAAENGPPSI